MTVFDGLKLLGLYLGIEVLGNQGCSIYVHVCFQKLRIVFHKTKNFGHTIKLKKQKSRLKVTSLVSQLVFLGLSVVFDIQQKEKEKKTLKN